MGNRQVLFITYNFPPQGGAGVQRSLKFVKYLPQFGWHPWVVTSATEVSPIIDNSLEADIPPGTPIYRVGGFGINNFIYQAGKYHLDRFAVLINLLLQIPDAQYFWSLNTHNVIQEIIKKANPELVYTTSGPYSTHLVGLWIKEKYQIPWFADFRDPWSTNLLIPYLPGYRALNRMIERRVLQTADRVACVSDPWLCDLRKNAGGSEKKFVSLPNGYDEDDVEPIPLRAPEPPFTITYLGSFYRNRKPAAFINAISNLIDSHQLPASAIRLMFIGKNSSQWVPEHPPFEVMGYIAHGELNQIRKETDIYLLLLDTSPENIGNYSGKLFEYMASNRPILGIVPENGVAQQLIQRSGTGMTVTGGDADIEKAIMQLFRAWQDGFPEWQPNWDIIQQYTRKNLTARLADEFNSIT